MNSTAFEKLEGFGLGNFINDFRFYLCDKTVSPNKVAVALSFEADQRAIINDPPDSFSKCEKLYELIQKTADVGKFLAALKTTGNEHILKFIKEANLSSGVTTTTTTNGNSSGSFSSPSSTLSRSTGSKAELVTQHLKNVDLGNFLKRNLLFLCRRTKNLSVLVICLIERGLVSEEEADAWSLLSNVDKCKMLYQEAGKTGSGDKLIQALQSSENEHIIEEMYTWINQ